MQLRKKRLSSLRVKDITPIEDGRPSSFYHSFVSMCSTSFFRILNPVIFEYE